MEKLGHKSGYISNYNKGLIFGEWAFFYDAFHHIPQFHRFVASYTTTLYALQFHLTMKNNFSEHNYTSWKGRITLHQLPLLECHGLWQEANKRDNSKFKYHLNFASCNGRGRSRILEKGGHQLAWSLCVCVWGGGGGGLVREQATKGNCQNMDVK